MADMNWEMVKAAYASGQESQREIAQRFHVSKRKVEWHSSKEGWVEARNEYRKKTAEKALERASDKDAQILDTLLGSIDKLTRQLNRALEDEEQMQRRPNSKSGADGLETEGKVYQKLDWAAARQAAATLKDLTATARDLLGIRSRQEEERFQLARERLALEREKASASMTDGGEIGVILMPEIADVPDLSEEEEQDGNEE